jgi:hypothetical protein
MRGTWIFIVAAVLVSTGAALLVDDEQIRSAARVGLVVCLGLGMVAILSYRRTVRRMRDTLNDVTSGGDSARGPTEP